LPNSEQGIQPTLGKGNTYIQERLARSQKRFQYAFLTSPDSVAIIRSRDRKYIDVNEMYSLFLGYAKQEIMGKSFLQVKILHDAKAQRNLLADIEKRGPVINREARFVDSSGKVKTGLLSVMKMLLDGKQHFVLAIRNIDALRQIEDALEKSEARYRELFNNMSSGVAVFDAIKAAKDGTFKGGVYVGTLANGGVGIASVAGASSDLNSELDTIKGKLIDGSLTVDGVLGQ
jgi:PAS domain S-box-containing protein